MKNLSYLAAVLVVAGAAYLSLPGRQPAPEVSMTYLDGSVHVLRAMRGQVVLVNFWATSCSACLREMPKLVEVHGHYAARGLQTVAVAMSYDEPAFVANYAQTRRLPFAVAHDRSGALAHAFADVQLTPTTFVINKRGEIVKRYVGEPDFVRLQALLVKLLDEPAPS